MKTITLIVQLDDNRLNGMSQRRWFEMQDGIREDVVTALDGHASVTNVIIDRRHPDNERRAPLNFGDRVRDLTDNIGRGEL